MKIGMILFIVGCFVAMGIGANYIMGGIEGGLPGGGAGHYSDYHDNPMKSYFGGGGSSSGESWDYTPGDVNGNPFNDQE